MSGMDGIVVLLGTALILHYFVQHIVLSTLSIMNGQDEKFMYVAMAWKNFVDDYLYNYGVLYF